MNFDRFLASAVVSQWPWIGCWLALPIQAAHHSASIIHLFYFALRQNRPRKTYVIIVEEFRYDEKRQSPRYSKQLTKRDLADSKRWQQIKMMHFEAASQQPIQLVTGGGRATIHFWSGSSLGSESKMRVKSQIKSTF